ncbi:hypothetical protein [Parapedobacter sp. 2B3]|uniref:hypothetical protein n=1 Tax=Parapedobacter sp. 2B3 TaxID=3342381 RepID=UPI0035B5D363
MSEREDDNELIHQLAERLRNHTVPYKDGAWERFAAAHGQRRRKAWPYWSAAAALVAAIGLYWFTRYSDETPAPLQVVQQEAMSQPRPAMPTEADRNVEGEKRPQRGTAGQRSFAPVQVVEGEEVPVVDGGADPGVTVETAVLAVAATDTATTPDPASHRVAAAIEPEEVEQPVHGDGKDVVFDPGVVDQGRLAVASVHKAPGMEKWDLGLVLSPSLTSEAVNIGGGVAVAYRISDKFSVGSGVSVAQLGLGKNPNGTPVNRLQQDMSSAPVPSNGFNGESASAVNYKREVSTTSSVVTLDIPLDLRYDVAKGFYTAVGLSYVAVLDERRTSHYVDRLNKNTFAHSQLSAADRLASTEFVYSSEKIPAKPLRGNGYAGFMNFSIGKKLPLSSKLSLSVEPYFKLPIGRLAKEEMNFTNGGIRIVTGF